MKRDDKRERDDRIQQFCQNKNSPFCNFYIETNNASIMPWYWRACQHSGRKRGMMCNNRAHNGMFLILPSHPFYTDVSSTLFRPARYAKNLQCAKTLFNIVMVIWLKINKYWMPIIRSSLLPLHQIDTNLSEGIWRLAGGSCDWPNGVNAWPIYPWLHLIGEMFTFWTFVPYLNAWCVWQSFKHDVFIAHVHITITKYNRIYWSAITCTSSAGLKAEQQSTPFHFHTFTQNGEAV